MNEKAQHLWKNTGHSRPDFALQTKPGQESVWDYPRPPSLVPDSRHIVVKKGELVVADSEHCYRVLETASPPTFYIPDDDVNTELLISNKLTSICEWKGQASYYDLKVADQTLKKIGWSYEAIHKSYEAIQHYLCFYPSKLECYVDGERVSAQQSDFYGGWITAEIVGPYKGDRTSLAW